MPNIIVKIPHGAFPGEYRTQLTEGIRAAASAAEQIPALPAQQSLCWILIEEMVRGGWTCGGADATDRLLPCMATAHVPAGVLDMQSRALLVQGIHVAFALAMPADDRRKLMTSILVNEVTDGHWGVGGELWHLPAFARAAGYSHLQHLLHPQGSR